ncbi:hypothetical protein TEA_007650 [Camellia sinensis var. sinensis]|uniref:Galactokinase N-terminal domain-containing protein n=1 Tax=Camellia sinensis var. sinensis TaxID=542762 RepID=A0A4S4D9Y8_CAMSN|nr:hypothetical protein TEA_007650 [Camellia sinensis var. sinensis]
MARHEELPIPVYSTLEPVYGDESQVEEAQLRFDRLKSKFLDVFGHPPQFYARSPGRVNLIGEHIDYEGYSVLPMAIRQDTIVAIRKNDAEKLLRIANVSDKYSLCTYPADPTQVEMMMGMLGIELGQFGMVTSQQVLKISPSISQISSILKRRRIGDELETLGLSLTPSSSAAVVGRVLNFWSSPEKLRPGTPSMNSEESGTTTLHESGGFGDQTKLLNLFT